MACKLNPRITAVGPEAGTEAWLAARQWNADSNPPVVLGASLAGTICGVDRYQTPLELYHRLLGTLQRTEQTEAMYWGSALEEPILKAYEERMEVHVDRPQHLYYRMDAPWIGATPDAVGTDARGRYCVEAKTASGYQFSRDNARALDCFGEGEDEVPMSYLLQCHQQMYVLDCERCDMPVLFDGREFRVYSIHANTELMRSLLASLQEFYRRLQERDAPEPDFGHASTPGLLKRVYGLEPGSQIIVGAEAQIWYEAWREAKQRVATAEQEKEIAAAHLLSIMGEAEVCQIADLGVSLRRTQVQPTLWAQRDVEEATLKLGSVKRAGYIRLSERKEKHS